LAGWFGQGDPRFLCAEHIRGGICGDEGKTWVEYFVQKKSKVKNYF
jgi:hypothetical protein